MKVKINEILDIINPRRVCRREGHRWIGFMSMGPHPDGGGGEFVGLRYVVRCTRCNCYLRDVPKSEWPDDGEVA